jgi:methionyl-tRNA formyltransferase
MRIDAGLDTGDILLQRELPIAAEDTAETMALKLAAVGADLMVETLRGLQAGEIRPRAQDHAQATSAPILKKEDGQINFHRSAVEIWNRLRGFQPWPGAYTTFRGKSLQIFAATPVNMEALVGTITLRGEGAFVGCSAHTALELLEVQMAGKKRMSARDFVNGYRPREAERMGEL